MNVRASKTFRFRIAATTSLVCLCAAILGLPSVASASLFVAYSSYPQAGWAYAGGSPRPPGAQNEPVAKQQIAGLIDRQHTQWADHDGGTPEFTMDNVLHFPGVFGGIVLNTSWNTLEPKQNGPLNFSSIDDALAQVRTYNASNADAPLGVKLRIWAGANAPQWAKKLAGGPVDIVRNPAGCFPSPCPLTVGKFWMPAYITAWRKFQAAVAAKYDSESLIRQVAVTSCAQQTDEPFVPTVDPTAKANLVAAGYTDKAQQNCLLNAITDYAAWKSTLIDFSFNNFSKIAGGADPAFTARVMKACRDALGARCILDNQALNIPLYSADQSIYDTMQSLGQPIQFQTAGPKAMNCQWTAVIAQAVALGALGVEVWPEPQYEGFGDFTAVQMRQLASEFTRPIPVSRVANVPTPCSGFH